MAEESSNVPDQLSAAAYQELRRLAYALRRGRRTDTLNPTALVHEAYIKLLGANRFQAESPEHLKFTLVRAMKFVLLDAARQKTAAMRGGGDVPMRRVAFDDPAAQAASIDPHDVLAVGIALDALAQQHELQARAFELQFFGGLQVSDIAGLLAVSDKRVQRLLRLARASLAVMLAGTEGARRNAG